MAASSSRAPTTSCWPPAARTRACTACVATTAASATCGWPHDRAARGLPRHRAAQQQPGARRLRRLQRGARLPLHRQGAAPRPPRRPRAPAARPRGRDPARPHPPAHRARLRARPRAAARADPRDAARHDARAAARRLRPAGRPRSRRAGRSAVLGHRLPAPPRLAAPRPQARQRHRRRGGRQGARPVAGATARRGRRRAGHTPVRLTRAGPRWRGGPGRRRLGRGRGAARRGDGPFAVQQPRRARREVPAAARAGAAHRRPRSPAGRRDHRLSGALAGRSPERRRARRVAGAARRRAGRRRLRSTAMADATVAEQEYLQTLFWLQEAQLPMTGANVARAMQLSAPTVHEMIGRLERDGYITRAGDKTISFTDRGSSHAEGIVRRHRLIERFLTDVLGIPWDEVHEEAERLEHAMSPVLEERMLAAIGDAKTCPHGHPIVAGTRIEGVPLADVEPGASVRILRFENEAEDLLHYLKGIGLEPGLEGTLAASDDEGDVVVEHDGSRIVVTRSVAETVSVLADPSPPPRVALPGQLVLGERP